ncbi:DUF4082 domain-containing protein [Paenibacillus tuaregi]|uniref:DUF4082 domain-containing protein n=1 Tax=Paenibacillus tuaregi TaxID=1816681 RepID=UPI00083822CA|nr:DUF4082 domain-containing protein [Paenibacillus tuaregi]
MAGLYTVKTPISNNGASNRPIIGYKMVFNKDLNITSMFFYRNGMYAAGQVQPRIYDKNGVLVGSNTPKTSSYISDSGYWQELAFSSPVKILAGQECLIGVYYSGSNLAGIVPGNLPPKIVEGSSGLEITLKGLYSNSIDSFPTTLESNLQFSFGLTFSVVESRVLIFNNGQYKYFDNEWRNLGGAVLETDFLSHGMSSIETISDNDWSQLQGEVELCYYTDDPSKTEAQFTIETTPFTLAEEWEDQTIKIIEYTDDPNQTESSVTLETEPFTLYDELGDSVDVLYYTDDPSATSKNLEITANYSPLDELTGDFDILTWTEDESLTTSNLTLKALPFEQLLLQPSDFKINGSLQSIIVNKITSQFPEGTHKYIVSFDSGQTWEAYKSKKWLKVNPTNLEEVKTYAMSLATLQTLKEAAFAGKGKQIRIGYYLDNSIHREEEVKLDNLKLVTKSPTDDVKFNELSFYLLNTVATLQMKLTGNKLTGSLDDTDKGKVQYRALLNGKPYFPVTGEFTALAPSPVDIHLNISERAILFNQPNTIRVEFQDAWRQTDFWEAQFIGTYSGLMFMDEKGEYLSDTFGGLLKYLNFDIIIAGQTTLEQKVVIKNQLGYPIKNLTLEVMNDKLPEGVNVELSRKANPFIGSPKLGFNQVINPDETIEVYVRVATTIDAKPWPGGQFEIRAKADKLT